MEKLFVGFTSVVAIFVLAFVIGLILSYPIMLLWNFCLVPAVTGINTITWLQAYGITVLCSFLFKSNSTTNKGN